MSTHSSVIFSYLPPGRLAFLRRLPLIFFPFRLCRFLLTPLSEARGWEDGFKRTLHLLHPWLPSRRGRVGYSLLSWTQLHFHIPHPHLGRDPSGLR